MNQEKKITSILNSLDEMDRAMPRPFFYIRLQARMQTAKGTAEKVLYFLSKPAVGIAAIALIIVINAVAIMIAGPVGDNKSAATTSAEIASVDEYSQMNTTFFDAEK